jgi:hypothetical protein
VSGLRPRCLSESRNTIVVPFSDLLKGHAGASVLRTPEEAAGTLRGAHAHTRLRGGHARAVLIQKIAAEETERGRVWRGASAENFAVKHKASKYASRSSGRAYISIASAP